MTISIDWANKIINVPKVDTQLIQSTPIEIRQLNLNNFRLDLKALEASEEGMPFDDTHQHNPPVTVGGVTLARVVEIINDYTVTFENGAYAVNLVGANSNVGDVVNLNTVSVRSANSAGLTYSKQVEDLAYEDVRVWVDTDNGVPGTDYPAGTPALPVDSFSDAYQIATLRTLPNRYRGVGTENISSFDLSNFDLLGASHAKSQFILESGCTTENLIVEEVTISGIFNGVVSLKECAVGDVTDFKGVMKGCGLQGTTILAEYTNGRHEFNNCRSNVTGELSTPIIDCANLSNLNVSIRGYAGGIEIINFDGSNCSMSIDLVAGHVILDSSVTVEDITIRGDGYLTNYSSASPNIQGLSADKVTLEIVRKFFTNRIHTDPSTGILTLYDDDDVTVLYSGNIYENVLATQLYRGQGMERRNKLT